MIHNSLQSPYFLAVQSQPCIGVKISHKVQFNFSYIAKLHVHSGKYIIVQVEEAGKAKEEC